jgi:hypothetical protein
VGSSRHNSSKTLLIRLIQNFALSQEMPMQRLAGYNALLRGYATPTTTVSQYQAGPNALQSAGALGTAAGGFGTLMGGGKKEGGAIKLTLGAELRTPMHLRVLPNEHQYHSFNSQCRAEN